jgi:hypothetical protein
MRIYPSPLLGEKVKNPVSQMAPAMPSRERFRTCEVPKGRALLPHHGLVDAITSNQAFAIADIAEMLRNIGGTMGPFERTAGV